MKTIAVVNQKGGVGKTTVSINLASALAASGQKTLLVDMDSQSHCAVGLAVPEDQIELTIYDVLISESRTEPIRLSEIIWEINENFELAPSSLDLAAFEQQTTGIAEREKCLKSVLDKVSDRYDYVVIDCPPAVSLPTFNALFAATDVVVPVETGYFSLHGLSKQLETLQVISKRTGRGLNVKVLASMYDIRTKMAREILAELKKHFAKKMFKTIVNFNTKIKEAASLGQPVGEYDSASKGTSDFKSLAEEIMGDGAKLQRQDLVNSLADQLEAITTSADELLEQTKPVVKPVEEEVLDLDDKLNIFYGVRQLNDAVMFVTLYPRANSVQIAGDFNNWQPTKTPLQKLGSDGVWQTKIKLPTGKHRYRLVVDGKWQQDPYNGTTELNPFGESNSVVHVH